MILLLGGSGFIGGAFRSYLDKHEIEYRSVSRADVNYYDPEQLISLIETTQTEFLINAAGYTGKPNVDACEIFKTDCMLGNAILPGKIREACEATCIPWGHVSSGCIYTGSRPDGSGFRETDEPNFCFRTNNCSWYSGCKALGEEILAGAENVYQWRLRIPFNHEDSERNYLSKLMRYNRLLDVENSISHLDDFVQACLDSWTKRIPYGIYNVTNPGSITTREIVQMIQDQVAPEKSFEFFDNEQDFLNKAVTTPRSNCTMDCSKLFDAGVQLRPVRESIQASLEQWSSVPVSN